MTVPKLLRVAMQVRDYQNERVAMPFVPARLVLSTGAAVRVDALVDSGAVLTLAHAPLAKLLKIPDAELRRGKPFSISGVGTDSQIAWPWLLDIELRQPRSEARLVLHDVPVWFTPHLPSGIPLLLGQRGALERLHFVQRSQPPEPEFVLKLA